MLRAGDRREGAKRYIGKLQAERDCEARFQLSAFCFQLSPAGSCTSVSEANAAARRFRERHGGQCAERAGRPLPEGSRLAVCRELWREPVRLLGLPSGS
jgi:hypothetical protein